MSKRVKLDQKDFAYSLVMEKFLRVKVKDSIKGEENFYFILYPGGIRKVFANKESGKRLLQKAQEHFGMKIRLVEFNDNPQRFIQNFIYPLKVEEISEAENDEIIIKDSDRKTKSLLIGRNARNLNVLNMAIGRYFNKKVRIV